MSLRTFTTLRDCDLKLWVAGYNRAAHCGFQKWVKKNGQPVRVSFGKKLLVTELVL